MQAYQSHHSKLYFMFVVALESDLYKQVFTCFKAGKKNFPLAEFCLPRETWWNVVSTWIEDARGRVYGCNVDMSYSKEVVFHRLFVVMYDHGKFVPIGKQDQPIPGVFRIPRHTSSDFYFLKVGRLSGKNSVFIKGNTYFDEHMSKYATYRTLQLKY